MLRDRLLVMEISEARARAVQVRQRIASFERSTYGREWSTADLISGLMTDVGDLASAVQRVDGLRPAGATEPLDELRHELGDCLWVLLVLADRYHIDLAEAFESTMVSIDAWLDSTE
jgi:NTP pyrophosphatase (non-canonical NTP hydrolase)